MKPHKQLFNEYIALYRPYLNRVNGLLSPFHLSVPLWSVMRLVFYEGPRTASDISSRQKVERPTMTKIIQKLKEMDYVEVESGEDRRTRIIQLTEKGKDVCWQIHKKLDEYQKDLLGDITEKDQLVVARVLKSISEKMMEDHR